MDLLTTIVFLFARAIPHVTPDFRKMIEGHIKEWHTKAKATESSWDQITVYLAAAIFDINLKP